jgi:hypothetical protein
MAPNSSLPWMDAVQLLPVAFKASADGTTLKIVLFLLTEPEALDASEMDGKPNPSTGGLSHG